MAYGYQSPPVQSAWEGNPYVTQDQAMRYNDLTGGYPAQGMFSQQIPLNGAQQGLQGIMGLPGRAQVEPPISAQAQQDPTELGQIIAAMGGEDSQGQQGNARSILARQRGPNGMPSQAQGGRGMMPSQAQNQYNPNQGGGMSPQSIFGQQVASLAQQDPTQVPAFAQQGPSQGQDYNFQSELDLMRRMGIYR